MKPQKNNSGPFDIFSSLDLPKAYLGVTIVVKVNDKITHIKRICKLFKRIGITHELYTPDAPQPKRFDLHFGSEADFQDVFIIVAILRNFGLKRVYFTENTSNEVLIGSYMAECSEIVDDGHGISPNKFLKHPFEMTMKEFLLNTFDIEMQGDDNDSRDTACPDDFYSENNAGSDDGSDLHDDANSHDDPYGDYDQYYYNEGYHSGNPRYDSNENPWIEVFGPGDEAETAYWNTD